MTDEKRAFPDFSHLCDGDAAEHTAIQDDAPDIRLRGWLIASASSHHYDGPRNTRWTVLLAYLTVGSKVVAASIGRTCWQGEVDRHAARVVDSPEELFEFLGHGRLAKDLYEKLGVVDAQLVD